MTETPTHRPKSAWKRISVLLVLIVSCVGCDRVTKQRAIEELRGRDPIEMASGFVRLEYAENTGAFLSLGDQLSEDARFWLLGIGTSLVLIVISWVLMRGGTGRVTFVALSLIVAGGIGNLFDRLSEGYVVDFVSLHLGPLRTGIFNVADVAITFGAILLFLGSFSKDEDSKAQPA